MVYVSYVFTMYSVVVGWLNTSHSFVWRVFCALRNLCIVCMQCMVKIHTSISMLIAASEYMMVTA